MPATFHFKAVAADGKARTGVLTAENERQAAQELKRQGLIPVFVGVQAPQQGLQLALPVFNRSRRKDVLFFTQELSTLLNANIPVDRALSITGEVTERESFKPVVADVLRALKGGKTLADSLATHSECFPEFYVNMVRAGEASGSLGPVFERLAEYERTRDDLRGYIISSMVYPALLTIVGIISVLVLMYFVVPRFAKVFADSRMQIPGPTRMMLEVSDWTRSYGGFVIGGFALGFVLFRAWIATKEGRHWWDGAKLRLPVLGDALRKAETSRFARAMSTLVGNGVPLVQSLGIARAILSNKRMSDALELVALGVKRGEGIALPLGRTAMFPPLASHLLSIGEETGRLDTMFQQTADIYDNETRAAIKRFTALFEPLIILVLGVLVGALILSMLVAITSINEVAV